MKTCMGPAVALALALMAAPGRAADLPAPVTELKLENGLTVLLAPDPAATTVDVAVWYRAGTRWERVGRTGITHLIEGLMFAGSSRFGSGEHRQRIAAAGGTLGTFTTPDYSCFYETVPPPALDLALVLEADRMASVTLTAATVEAARRQAIAARKASSAENAPVGQGLRALYALAWAGHPYRWPASGLTGDLPRITLADCIAFHRERYGPGNALVTVVGRFDPAVAEASVRRAFSGVARRPSLPTAPVATAAAGGRARRNSEAQVPLVFAGWRTPPDSSADGAALEVLARALGSGHRLERELVQKQRLCLLTQGDLDSRREGGLLFAIAAARPGADTAAVESALLNEVEKLAGEPLQPEELEGAKRQAEAELLMGWQTTRGFAQSLGAARLLDGDVTILERRLAQLRALSAEDVSRVAARVLTPRNRALVWLMPGAAQAPGSPGPRAPRPAPVPTPKGGR